MMQRNTEAMAARNNQSRMQLEAKQQELQHRLGMYASIYFSFMPN